SYVLPSIAFGAEFLDDSALWALDVRLRQWGKRLLQWPRGALGAAVLGDLGWAPFVSVTLDRAAGLMARLSAAPFAAGRRQLTARIFQFARGIRRSWASQVTRMLVRHGVPLPCDWGVGPGVPTRLVKHWRSQAAAPLLQVATRQAYSLEVSATPSLADYLLWQPIPILHPTVFNCAVAPEDVRAWSLARCGHHELSGGRSARHRGHFVVPCPCGFIEASLDHVLFLCPVSHAARARWYAHLARLGLSVSSATDVAAALRLIFCSADARNGFSAMVAHVRFVSEAFELWRAAASELQGD
ncbi:unnamed protein product, partial [Polarella glacialis]